MIRIVPLPQMCFNEKQKKNTIILHSALFNQPNSTKPIEKKQQETTTTTNFFETMRFAFDLGDSNCDFTQLLTFSVGEILGIVIRTGTFGDFFWLQFAICCAEMMKNSGYFSSRDDLQWTKRTYTCLLCCSTANVALFANFAVFFADEFKFSR